MYNIHEEEGASGNKNIVFNISSGGGIVKPSQVAASNITSTSATVTWTGANDNYRIRYRTAGIEATVFEDDFENGLSEWTIYTEGEAMGEDGWLKISLNNPKAHSGNNVACSFSWYENVVYDADNWLVTPQVTIGKTLKFWVLTYSGSPDSYEVLLSTTGNATTDFTVTLQAMAEAPNNGSWNEVEIDLSAYTGQLGYIAIHHKSKDCFYLFIDDFGIYSDAVEAGEWQTATVSESSIELKGLTPATTYEVQVQSFIDEETSAWSESTYFTTEEAGSGDTNGDGKVDAQDASLVLQYVANKISNILNADVNGDGKVDAQDASLILQYVANKITW